MTTKTINGYVAPDSPHIEVGFRKAYTMDDKSAGGTAFGLVNDGNVMGKITATGKVRPCGNTKVSAGQTSATVKVDNAKNFFIGDLIDVISAGAVGSLVWAVNGGTAVITLTGRNKDGKAHAFILTDPSGNDKVLSVGVTESGGVRTTNVSLATGGAGAITSTAAQVAAAINAAVGDIVTAVASGDGNPVLAKSSTPLAGGIATGAQLLNGEAITGVDKTSVQHTVTTGTSITSVAGDDVRLDNGAETALGLLVGDANSYTGRITTAGAVETEEPPVYLSLRGVAETSKLPVALSAAQLAALGDRYLFV
jgi:hypothetical protein